MADLKKIIEIVFDATNNIGPATTGIGNSLDTFAAKASAVTGPMADVSDAIVKTDLALGALGVAFLGFAYKEAIEFEAAALDLQKVLSDSEGSVDSYIPKIDDLALTYGVAGTNVLAAAANFKQSGFDIEQSLNLVDLSLQATKISELDANAASELLVATLKGFGAEADTATKLLDILNAVSNTYSVSVGELGKGMAALSPIAKAAGLDYAATAGLLTPIIETYRNGDVAATALKTSLLRLSSDTAPVIAALDKLRVSQHDANGELRQSGDIVKDLAAVWPGLSAAQQTYYAAELVGIDQAGKFQTALGNWSTVLGATEVALNSAGSAHSELAVRMQAAEVQVDRFTTSMGVLMRNVGGQFKTEMTGVIGATGDLSVAFADLVRSGGLDPLFNQLKPLLADFESDLRAIAKALPAAFAGLNLDPVVKGFEAIGISAGLLFKGVDLKTAEGLQSALQDIVNIGGGFLQVTGGIVQGLTPLLRQLAEMGQSFGTTNPELQAATGNMLGLGKAADILLGLLSPLGGGVEALGTGLQAIAASSALKTVTGLSGASSALLPILGRLGLAGAVGTLAYELGRWADLNDRLIPGVGTVGTAIFDLLNPMHDVNLSLQTQQQALEQDGAELAQFTLSLGALEQMVTGVSEEERNLIDTDKELSTLNRQLAAEFAAQGVEMVGYADDTANADRATGDLISSTSELKGETQALVKEVFDAQGNLVGFEQATRSTSTALKETAKETEATRRAAEAYHLEMQKLANDKAIANIEAQVTLNVAELEAQSKQVEAAFASIDTAIGSTGDLLGKLFDSLNGAELRDKFNIEDQIKKENDLRERTFRLQEKLTESQIKYLNEKASSLRRGDGLITITGDGLEPELEAFMWKIVERVQIKASDEGAELLLGIL